MAKIIMSQTDYIRQFNYDDDHFVHQVQDFSTETIADQSYSIRELLVRFTSNNLPNVAKNPIYSENPSFADLDVFDMPDCDLVDCDAVRRDLEFNKAERDRAQQVNNNSVEDGLLSAQQAGDPQKSQGEATAGK